MNYTVVFATSATTDLLVELLDDVLDRIRSGQTCVAPEDEDVYPRVHAALLGAEVHGRAMYVTFTADEGNLLLLGVLQDHMSAVDDGTIVYGDTDARELLRVALAAIHSVMRRPYIGPARGTV